jgi:hypothetical protein
MFGEEILMEIDSTLDRLIRNAEAIQNVNVNDLSEMEIDAFQKTQESLLQHLIHMDQFLEAKRKNLRLQDKRSASFKIQEKLLKFEKLKSSYHKTIAETAARKTELMSKRRAKRFLVHR